MNVARLLLPAVRWSAEDGFEQYRKTIEHGLEIGVGGFILFNGDTDSVRSLTDELHRRSRHPLLVASDLERGAGQQFRGATPLPPAAAIGSLGEPEAAERAGELTAREARALGVNWIYAPVADVDLESENPIIGSRAFGTRAEAVAANVAAWVRGCTRGGALSCAKHFPGHGRTVGDSHIERPCVEVPRQELEADLLPFRRAVEAGVSSLMTAHVCYPALDPSNAPATLSRPILTTLLREEMGFEGLVVTDAIIMEGLTAGTTEVEGAIMAVAAGCDVLLYPDDLDAVVQGVEAAVEDGRLPRERVEDALARIARAAERVAGGAGGEVGADEDRRWSLETAVRSLRVIRGTPRLPAGAVRLIEVEDDLGGPWPPYPRVAFPASLREAGVELSDGGEPLVVVYSDIRAWKGRPGVSREAQERVRELMEAHPDATVILFSLPRLAEELPTARNLLAAWGGEGMMQQAAVAWLTGRGGGLAGLHAGMDR